MKANEEQIFDKLEKAMSLQGFINILEDYVGKNKLQELAIDLYQDMSQFKSKKEKSAIISKIRKEMPEYNAESIRCELEECFDLGEVKNVLAKYLGSKKVSDLSQEFFD